MKKIQMLKQFAIYSAVIAFAAYTAVDTSVMEELAELAARNAMFVLILVFLSLWGIGWISEFFAIPEPKR